MKTKKLYPITVFSAFISVFVLFFTRLFMKMDDGNFLGIALSPDFSYSQFLASRYMNISGRTINEFLVMFFARHNIILWKFFLIFLLVFIVYFFIKLSSFFVSDERKNQAQIFCCMAMFLMMVSCLNPAVFWFAGSISYLLPFAGLCGVALPFSEYIYNNKFNLLYGLIGVVGCIFASSQEQAAVCCLVLITVLIIAVKIKKLKVKPIFFLYLAVSVFFTFYLFSSPGMDGRMDMEAKSFSRFTEFNIIDKIFMGLSAFFANNFYLSVVLILILISLLSLTIYEKMKKKKPLLILNFISLFVVIFLNAFCCIFEKGLAHMIIRKAFLSGDFSLGARLLISGGFVLLIILVLLSVKLCMLNFKIGFSVLLSLGAGLGCAIIMGFSSSIFASGQRVFFFTNMFIICACIILFSNVKKSKMTDKIFTVSIAYATLTVIVNIFAFTFSEFPLLG